MAKSKDKGINPNNNLVWREARRVREPYEDAYNEMLLIMTTMLIMDINKQEDKWKAEKVASTALLLKRLNNALTIAENKATKQVERGMETVYYAGQSSMNSAIITSGYTPTIPVLPLTGTIESTARQAVVNTLSSKTNKYLTSKHNIILKSANAQYRTLVNQSVALVNSGQATLKQAVAHFLEQVPPGAKFVDRSGRQIRMDAYAEMATRTGFVQGNLQGSLDRMTDYGLNLVLVSSHAGACPLCQPWEDMVLSTDGNASGYETLDDAMGAGLFHPNCGHSVTPYHERMIKPPLKSQAERRQDALLYDRKQKLNYINRNVRKWQDKRYAVQDIASNEDMKRLNAKVKQWRKASRDYAKQYNLKNYNLPKIPKQQVLHR